MSSSNSNSNSLFVLIRDENSLFYNQQPVSFQFNQTGTYLHLGSLNLRTRRLQVAHGLGRHELVLSTPNRSLSIRPTSSSISEWTQIRRALRLHTLSPLRYFYTAILGRGRFGTVYQARVRQTAAQVAVKQILKSDLRKSGFPLRLARRELSVLTNLPSHQSIVSVLDVHENSTSLFTVMEYIHGCSLAALNRSRVIPEKEIVSIITQLLQAIQHLHEHSIVHRDLKLENVMVKRSDGQQQHMFDVKVCDFGLALNIEQADQNDLQSKVGTGYTQAPELVLEEYMKELGWTIDERRGIAKSLDLWSLGVVLFSLIYKRLPFGEMTDDRIPQMKELISLCDQGKSYMQVILSPDERIRTPRKLYRVLTGLMHPDAAKRLDATSSLEILTGEGEIENRIVLSTGNAKKSIRQVAKTVVSLVKVIQSFRSNITATFESSTLMLI